MDGPHPEDRVAIVTGAAGGIGRVVAEALASARFSVVATDLARTGLDAIVADFRASGLPVVGRVMDVTARDDVRTVVRETVSEHGRLDVFVNNAGIGHVSPLLEIDEVAWDEVFAVNLKGPLFGIQEAGSVMKEQRGGGRIVNVASVAGKSGRPLLAAYAASKAALISLTQSSALALAPHRITVNSVCPGVVETQLGNDVLAKMERLVEEGRISADTASIPPAALGPSADPRDIAQLIVFLAGPSGSYITGQSWNVDGGRVMH